jgi:hypothetical protein
MNLTEPSCKLVLDWLCGGAAATRPSARWVGLATGVIPRAHGAIKRGVAYNVRAGDSLTLGGSQRARRSLPMAPSAGNPLAHTVSECEADDQNDCDFQHCISEGLERSPVKAIQAARAA